MRQRGTALLLLGALLLALGAPHLIFALTGTSDPTAVVGGALEVAGGLILAIIGFIVMRRAGAWSKNSTEERAQSSTRQLLWILPLAAVVIAAGIFLLVTR